MYQINEFLLQLGLSGKEVKAYLELLKTGAQSSGQLAKKLKLPRSTTLFCLNTLEEKGFARKELYKNTQKFSPIHPSEIEEIIERRQRKLESQLKELDKLSPYFDNLVQQFIPTSRVQIFEGVEGVCRMIDLELEKDRPVYFISGHKLHKDISAYIENTWVPKRKQCISKCQMIIADSKNAQEYLSKAKGIYDWIGLLTPQDGNNIFYLTIAIYDNSVQILSCKDTLMGVLIENEYLAKTMKTIFSLLKNTKKIDSV